MPTHEATISWFLANGDFAKGTYDRSHTWQFDGGLTCLASASPHVVPPPLSNPAGIDPEEALIAAIASCHMLWFLDLARRAGYTVASYRDHAAGQMMANSEGKHWLSRVDLYPRTTWIDEPPLPQTLRTLHHEAHANCYIANSVKTMIKVHLETS